MQSLIRPKIDFEERKKKIELFRRDEKKNVTRMEGNAKQHRMLVEGEPLSKIESMCPKCHDNGFTTFLLMKIPHFNDTLISAFECSHCGYSNKEVQNVSRLQDFGLRIQLNVQNKSDMNRQIVKSEYCTLSIPELELELPPTCLSSNEPLTDDGTGAPIVKPHRAIITTLEGFLLGVMKDLEEDQEARQLAAPDVYEKIAVFISKVGTFIEVRAPFTVILDDPSGNSYIELVLENLTDVESDGQVKLEKYSRTKAQLEALGFSMQDVNPEHPVTTLGGNDEEGLAENNIYEFPGTCPSCSLPCVTRMHPVDIPYFKEVIIMATVCDHCYYKSNEIRSGTKINAQGTKILFKLEGPEDLSRDILKSESCRLLIPEIDLELSTGTLGGRFTTIEGLLVQVREELEEKAHFLRGDSATTGKKNIFEKLLSNLDQVASGTFPCTIILDDPLSNSYIQNLYAPDPDPQISVEQYERTFEQNEDFGLNDLNTDQYEESSIQQPL